MAAAVFLNLLLGVGALAGGMALVAGPTGQIIPLSVSSLAGSPFHDYFIPGLILFVVLGLAPFVVAILAWRGNPWAPLLTVGIALTLLIWLAVEVAIVGYSSDPPLQPIYLGIAVLMMLDGIGWLRSSSSTV
jgi:hypothetical protein